MSFDIYFAGAQTPTVDDFIYNLGANRLYSYFSERKHIDNYIERIKQETLLFSKNVWIAPRAQN